MHNNHHQRSHQNILTKNQPLKKKIVTDSINSSCCNSSSSSSSSLSSSSYSSSSSSFNSNNKQKKENPNIYYSKSNDTDDDDDDDDDNNEHNDDEGNYYIKINELQKTIRNQDKELYSLQKQMKQLKLTINDLKNRSKFFWGFVMNENGIKLYESLPKKNEIEKNSNKIENDNKKNLNKKEETLIFPATCIYPYKKVLKMMEPFIETPNENGIACTWVRVQFIALNNPKLKELWCPIKINNEYQVDMFHLRDNYQLPVEMLNFSKT